jgi:acyl-CoA thioesterase I
MKNHPHSQPRIIALGDSITYGYPFGNKYSWVELLSEKLGLPIINAGANGNNFRDMLNRLLTDVVDQKPDYVIFLGGANDVYQGNDVEGMEERFKKILKVLKESKIKTILGLPPPLEGKEFEAELAKFRRFLKKFAKDHRLPLINFYDPFLDSRKKKPGMGLLEDGVHPSAAGYKLMAEVAYPAVQKILK